MVEPSPEASSDIYEMTSAMAHGDEEAYRRFYEEYCDRLFRYLLVVARGDEEFCRDILQNAMIKVIRYMRPFEREEVFWSWLTQIARTSFIDAVRKQLRQPQVVNFPQQEWPALVAPEPSTDSAPLLEALQKSLEELAEDERRLIQAAYFEGATHKDLAARDAATPKAVESRLARIRQKLRNRILSRLKHEE